MTTISAGGCDDPSADLSSKSATRADGCHRGSPDRLMTESTVTQPLPAHRLGPVCHATQGQGKLYFPSCASLVAVPESDLDSHVFSSKTRTLATGTLAHDNARRADSPCGSRRCFPSKIVRSLPPFHPLLGLDSSLS